jgi:hypothetical protein
MRDGRCTFQIILKRTKLTAKKGNVVASMYVEVQNGSSCFLSDEPRCSEGGGGGTKD